MPSKKVLPNIAILLTFSLSELTRTVIVAEFELIAG